MNKVKLWTSNGGYVTTVDVPNFVPMPEVLVWGQRFFTRESDIRYKEAFTYFIPIYSSEAK